jgi:hypothetical protein
LEALSQVFFSPPWGPNSRAFGDSDHRAWGANRRQLGAPAASGDGQVTVFNLEDIFADTGVVSLQALNSPPGLPAWLSPVGQAYRFVSDAGAGDLELAVAFNYLQREAPPGYEHTLNLYYSPDNGETWQRLFTDLDLDHNQATAVMPGGGQGGPDGIYALVATLPMPALNPGWNQFAYPLPGSRGVGEALASIEGSYTSVYHQDATGFQLYDATVLDQHPEFASLVNDLAEFAFGNAYWIYATQAVTPYLGVPTASRPVAAVPNLLPATYYGWVSASPGFTPTVGMELTAWVNGILCGQGEVVELGGELAYKIQVSADTGDSCGVVGRATTFEVDNGIRLGSTLWDNRQAWFLPLPYTGSGRLYLPIITR